MRIRWKVLRVVEVEAAWYTEGYPAVHETTCTITATDIIISKRAAFKKTGTSSMRDPAKAQDLDMSRHTRWQRSSKASNTSCALLNSGGSNSRAVQQM